MTAQPDALTDTPNQAAQRLLQDVLSMIHLTGSLLVRAEFTAPWGYHSPEAQDVRQMLDLTSQRLLLFHLIPEGRCWVEVPGLERVELEGGDAVVLPYADMHRVGSPSAEESVPIQQLMPPTPWSELPVIRYGGGGPPTEFVCGYIVCDELLFNPFLRALPRVFRVRPPEGPATDWMRASVAYALQGAPPPAAQRLFELIFVEMLRLYVSELPAEQTGWLGALADPILGRALLLLHGEPAAPWTVQELAKRVATSRSVLDERFRKSLGRAPMRYLMEWRLQLAAEELRTSSLTIAEIAQRVGYESEASFSRAFRRHVGEPPARWRDTMRETRAAASTR